MSFSLGIVGLPNVGKSTLFKALTKKPVLIANYPFATIDPNVGVVEVPDKRLAELDKVSKSEKIIPTTIEFVDIAGLVKGASEGEGLGNKFLSHIREVAAIVMVVRAFHDPEVMHVSGRVNPQDDLEVIGLELALADLDQAKRRLAEWKSKAKAGLGKNLEIETALFEKIVQNLEKGQAIRDLNLSEDEKKMIKSFCFLTAKPLLVVLNTDEEGPVSGAENLKNYLAISAKIEAELAYLPNNEAKQMMVELGMKESGLEKLITASYHLLGLITFLTSGPKETRAWTVKQSAKAPEAAGVIHSDFEKGFIRAEVCDWRDFVALGGWPKLKESGKLRLEGKDYVMRDGDTVYFHVSA